MLMTLKDKCNAGSFDKKMWNLKEINKYLIFFSIFADQKKFNNNPTFFIQNIAYAQYR